METDFVDSCWAEAGSQMQWRSERGMNGWGVPSWGGKVFPGYWLNWKQKKTVWQLKGKEGALSYVFQGWAGSLVGTPTSCLCPPFSPAHVAGTCVMVYTCRSSSLVCSRILDHTLPVWSQSFLKVWEEWASVFVILSFHEVVFLIGFRQAIKYWRAGGASFYPLFSSFFPNLICPSNPHSILPPERWVIKADGNEVTISTGRDAQRRETCSSPDTEETGEEAGGLV